MRIPETTSAEGLELYMGGKCLVTSRGEAWRDIKVSLFALPSTEGMVSLPSVSEPVLTWIVSGDQEVRERELQGPWITSRVKAKSFFLTTSGAPYECHWKMLTPEPVEFMLVRVELPLLQRAFAEVFGKNASHAQLQDVSGFTDATLSSYMEQLYGELKRRKASLLLVEGIAQAIAIHLARNYTVLIKRSHKADSSLPGYKLRQVTAWMTEHLAEEFNLARLAAQVGLSKFHFNRLFKSAMGVSPSHYHITLRLNTARQMLRETDKSIMDVALDVGYSNPSHFARLFQRETGLSPSDYRRKR